MRGAFSGHALSARANRGSVHATHAAPALAFMPGETGPGHGFRPDFETPMAPFVGA